MNLATYQKQCLEKLTWATRQLGVVATEAQLAKIAEIIVHTMTGPWRYFHTPDHIFLVGGTDDAIEVLAALFHDLVYVQIDHSINFNLTYYVAPFVHEGSQSLLIRDRDELPDDLMFQIVMALFDFAPGQSLSPYGGQNEFLSALVAAKVLESLMPPSQIALIVACIEITIPFRTFSQNGTTIPEQLYQRLCDANEQFQLGLSQPEIEQTLRRAVRLANRDVGGFGSPSSAQFLDNTWNLLPETNHHLENPSSYTIRAYREALAKMEGFLNFLDPNVIFVRYGNEPSELAYQGFVARAKKNLSVGQLYLMSKIVAVGLLEALATRFGREMPLAMMMGELPTTDMKVYRLGDFLPQSIPNAFVATEALEREVFTLLERGRLHASSYDLSESPLATLVVKFIGFSGVRDLRTVAQTFFDGKTDAERFLAQCDRQMVEAIVDGVSQLMLSRQQALCRTLSMLPSQ